MAQSSPTHFLSRHLPLRSRRLVAVLAVTIPAGIAAIVVALAAGGFITAEPENGTLSGNATVVSDAAASGSKAVHFGSATPTPPPSGYPDQTNTGYMHAPDYPGSLHACATPIQSNATYNFCNFPNGVNVGSADSPVSNVTFHGCWFHGVDVGGALILLYGNNITFDYSSVTPNISAPPTAYAQSYEYGIESDGGYYSNVGKLTVTNSDFWGFDDAIDTNGSTQANPQVFRGNWIHDSAADGGVAHVDGIGTESGGGNSSYDVIDHNTIESSANTNALAFQGGTYSNFTITNNLFGGFGYTVNITGGTSNFTFTGNTFSTLLPIDWGPLYPESFWTTPGSTWKGNKWLVPSGAAWGNPAHSGWFWIPSTDATSGSSDTPYVSQTDYAG